MRAERTALNEGRQKIAEEIDALETAPLAKEDVLQFIGDYIDRRAADYPKNEGNWFFPGYLDVDARRIGPPLAKRRDLIAKLRSNADSVDARIAEIDTELAGMTLAARGA